MEQPSLPTLIKLLSALVHADEFMSENGVPVDKATFQELMSAPEVKQLLGSFDSHALLPIRRDGVRYKIDVF